jgi:hypothetical protein
MWPNAVRLCSECNGSSRRHEDKCDMIWDGIAKLSLVVAYPHRSRRSFLFLSYGVIAEILQLWPVSRCICSVAGTSHRQRW